MITQLVLLFVASMLYGSCYAIAANIRDVRTENGEPPYRDLYHLLDAYLGRAMLMVIASDLTLLWLISGFWIAGAGATVSLVTGYLFWRHIYQDDAQFCYQMDEAVSISTGVPWLDKLLGFHH